MSFMFVILLHLFGKFQFKRVQFHSCIKYNPYSHNGWLSIYNSYPTHKKGSLRKFPSGTLEYTLHL
jgi:hypothetical protein